MNEESEKNIAVERIAHAVEGSPILLATGKLATYEAFRTRLLEEYPVLSAAVIQVLLLDPELSAEAVRSIHDNPELDEEVILYAKPAESASYQAETEPAAIGSKEAVEFKLARAEQFFEDQPEMLEKYLILAADVAFWINGQPNHKLLRSYQDEEQYRLNGESKRASDLEKLNKLYCREPFSATWEAAYGLSQNGERSITSLYIFAEYPALNPEEVEHFYNPRTNTGIGLIEVAEARGDEIKFVLVDQNGAMHEVDLDIARKIVIEKIPPELLLEALLYKEIESNPVVAAPAGLAALRQFQTQ